MRVTQLWQRFSSRERMLVGAALVALLAVAFRYGVIGPYLAYKEQVEENIVQELQRIEKSLKQISRGPQVERRVVVLRQRYQGIVSRLIPGETPSLAAAHLQERLQGLASQSGLEIVTTQVMRDEAVREFHKVSVQLTLRGETSAFADFLAAVEYDSWWLTVATLDIRAYPVMQQFGREVAPRPLTVTMEVGGFMQESAPAAAATEDRRRQTADGGQWSAVIPRLRATPSTSLRVGTVGK
ncbi:MAG: hypothetical protein HYZ72_21180 [Deltaproteobacteria bacterium]|nr:hypothetical protein [Deltaproteobacteria bacterium]